MANWQSIRKDFPVLQEHVFLDTAYHYPSFRLWDKAYQSFKRSHETRRVFTEDISNFKPVMLEDIDQICRVKVAKLIQCKPEEILFFSSTTDRLCLVTQMIDWKEGDKILINDGEFPSNVFPWRNL